MNDETAPMRRARGSDGSGFVRRGWRSAKACHLIRAGAVEWIGLPAERRLDAAGAQQADVQHLEHANGRFQTRPWRPTSALIISGTRNRSSMSASVKAMASRMACAKLSSSEPPAQRLTAAWKVAGRC